MYILNKKEPEQSRSLTKRGGSVVATLPRDLVVAEAARQNVSLLDFVLNFETVFEIEHSLTGRTRIYFRRKK